MVQLTFLCQSGVMRHGRIWLKSKQALPVFASFMVAERDHLSIRSSVSFVSDHGDFRAVYRAKEPNHLSDRAEQAADADVRLRSLDTQEGAHRH